MSFVKTVPEALAAAASQLEGIGTSFTTESAAAAGSTTGLAPAAADPVSALQAGIFSTYGQLYQSVSSQATAIHQLFTSALGTSAGSYGETEAANQVAAASTPLSGLGSLFGGSSSGGPINGLTNLINNATTRLTGSPVNSPLANLTQIQMGDWASAYSDVIGMGGGGLLTALAGGPTAAAGGLGGLGGLAAGLDGAVMPATAAAGVGGLGGAPVLASMGQASALGALSVPPSWAGAVPVAGVTPATLTGAGWTVAPHAGSVATLPAGMPTAGAGRGGYGYGYGAPRYGVKPKVMPKPTAV